METLGLVIPTVKEGPFLVETVKSVAMAIKDHPIEIYIFQNGHTIQDKTKYEKIIGSIRWVQSEKIEHVADSWNKCVELANNNSLIHLLHDDDFIHPNFFDEVFKAADQHKDVGLIATGVLQVDGESLALQYKPYNKAYRQPSRSSFIAEAETNIFECPGVVIVNRDLSVAELFSRDFRLLTDWDAWTRIILTHGAVQIPSVLAYYRIHGLNYSKQLRSYGRDAKERVRYYRKYRDFRTENKSNDKKRIARSLIQVIRSKNSARLSRNDLIDLLQFIGFCFFIVYSIKVVISGLFKELVSFLACMRK